MRSKVTTADLKWSKRVRERDKCCQICKKTDKRLNAHHLIPKHFSKWRHDMDNGISLCVSCHQFGVLSAHKNPLWFSRWLRIHRNKTYQIAIRRLQEIDGGNNEV